MREGENARRYREAVGVVGGSCARDEDEDEDEDELITLALRDSCANVAGDAVAVGDGERNELSMMTSGGSVHLRFNL